MSENDNSTKKDKNGVLGQCFDHLECTQTPTKEKAPENYDESQSNQLGLDECMFIGLQETPTVLA